MRWRLLPPPVTRRCGNRRIRRRCRLHRRARVINPTISPLPLRRRKAGLPLFGSRNVLARCHTEGFNALMSDHIYKKIELVSSSPNGIEDAVNNAISRAGKTIRNMSWFEVAEVRGSLENNKVAHWQVTVKAGFTLDRC